VCVFWSSKARPPPGTVRLARGPASRAQREPREMDTSRSPGSCFQERPRRLRGADSACRRLRWPCASARTGSPFGVPPSRSAGGLSPTTSSTRRGKPDGLDRNDASGRRGVVAADENPKDDAATHHKSEQHSELDPPSRDQTPRLPWRKRRLPCPPVACSSTRAKVGRLKREVGRLRVMSDI
jgi:hypothetical protein